MRLVASKPGLLRALKDLREEGLLTEAEFRCEKEKLLAASASSDTDCLQKDKALVLECVLLLVLTCLDFSSL